MAAKPWHCAGAFKIIGAIWLGLGAVFLAIGIGIGFVDDTSARMISLLFSSFGAFFALGGLAFLLAEGARRRTCRRLAQSGRYVWGHVSDWQYNRNVTINGLHPYVLLVSFTTPVGETRSVRSENLRYLPEEQSLHRAVRVYYADERFRKLYAAVDELYTGASAPNR